MILTFYEYVNYMTLSLVTFDLKKYKCVILTRAQHPELPRSSQLWLIFQGQQICPSCGLPQSRVLLQMVSELRIEAVSLQLVSEVGSRLQRDPDTNPQMTEQDGR